MEMQNRMVEIEKLYKESENRNEQLQQVQERDKQMQTQISIQASKQNITELVTKHQEEIRQRDIEIEKYRDAITKIYHDDVKVNENLVKGFAKCEALVIQISHYSRAYTNARMTNLELDSKKQELEKQQIQVLLTGEEILQDNKLIRIQRVNEITNKLNELDIQLKQVSDKITDAQYTTGITSAKLDELVVQYNNIFFTLKEEIRQNTLIKVKVYVEMDLIKENSHFPLLEKPNDQLPSTPTSPIAIRNEWESNKLNPPTYKTRNSGLSSEEITLAKKHASRGPGINSDKTRQRAINAHNSRDNNHIPGNSNLLISNTPHNNIFLPQLESMFFRTPITRQPPSLYSTRICS